VQGIFVRASEFARQFGHLSQAGRTVFVTHHGRETHALLPIANYHEFVATAKHDDHDAIFSNQELADWLPLLLVVIDDQRTIVMANRTAHAMARKGEGALPGRGLFDAFPALKETMFESYCNRTERTGEPCSFELPGLFGSDTWHRMETFRTHQGVVMLARDITDDVKAYRLADTKKALIEAILAHGGIGYIWFNVRGRIEQVDEAMSDLLQLPRERLSNVPVIDLVPVGQRVMLRDVIEGVLSHGGTQRFETEFLCNDGTIVPAVGAIKDLRGVYGSEGAVMVVTRK
jgi:PAS domain-containing protein